MELHAMHSTQTTRYCGYATKLIGLQAIVLLTACASYVIALLIMSRYSGVT